MQDIAKSLTKDYGKPQNLKFIDSGCTLLNLAVSQRMQGGWARGRVINFVGDGSSGKTLLAVEACANAFYKIQDVRKKYIVFNNVEGVMDFDIAKMYGQRFAESIIWESTDTCEKLGRDYMRWLQRLKKGDFLLYVADSLDATVSSKAQQRTLKSVKQGVDEEGSYGTDKAKYFSASLFNNLCGMMQGKDATLICVSQVREKIGIMFGEKYYRTGGKALDFYTHQVAWLAEKEKIKKSYKKHERVIGAKIKVNIKRNKVTKPFRQCEFKILFDYGVDDIETNLEFLYGDKKDRDIIEWPRASETIKFAKKELVEYLETRPKAVEKLKDMVANEWFKIERKTLPNRKAKYEQ